MFSLPAKYWLSFYFISFYFIWGVFLPFWGVWLEDQGISSENIGVLFSVGLVLRFISSLSLLPKVASAKATLRLLRVLAFLLLVSFSFLFYFQGEIWLSIMTLCINFLIAPMMPLGDIVGTRLVKQIHLDYGRVRLWGSISFIVGSTFIGWLIVEYGKPAVLWVIIAATLIMWITVLFNLAPHLEDAKEIKKKSEQSLFTLFKTSNVFLFVLITGAIQGAHGAYYAFSSIYWGREGLSGVSIAWLWGIGVFAEVLVMRFNTQLFSAWSIKQMLLLGLVASIIRWSAFALTSDVYLLALIQTFHGLTFAATHLAAIRYIGMQKNSDIVRYQSLYSGVGLGLMTALFTFVSGLFFDSMGANIFLIMALFLLPVFWCIKIWKLA